LPHRRFLTAILLTTLLVCFVAAGCKGRRNGHGNAEIAGEKPAVTVEPLPGPKRNVLVITIDSLRHDHVGSYGYTKPTTPRLDAFAETGVRFARAYAPASWTLPSHASLFTGLYPQTNGVEEDRSVLDERLPTLGERLQARGYRTGAVVCAPFLSTNFGLNRGFETYNTDLVSLLPLRGLREKVAPDVTEKGLAWLDETDDRPWFLFLHYWDVHHDYNPPRGYVDLFDPGYEGDEDGLNITEREELKTGFDPRDLAHIVALYDGEIRYTDDGIGMLLDGLKERGLMENTMIFITSDHGEEFLEHGQMAHKKTCYEESVRIPLLASIPWVKAKAPVVEEAVNLIDLMPTILDLLGADRSDLELQGQGLAGLIRDGDPLEPRVLLTETLTGLIPGIESRLRWSAMLTQDGKKLHAMRERTRRGPGKLRWMLFDLPRDPGEQNDVHANRRSVANRLKGRLRATTKKLRDQREKLTVADDTQQELDPQTAEALKGLGYLR
jgi:arylsulfatase A-like enzyme